MTGPHPPKAWVAAKGWPRTAEEKLDRALVAGLMLEVILEAPESPGDPQARRHLIKTRLKGTLVSHLAGRVTLDRFRTLVGQLENWFPLYYPLIAPEPAAAAAGPALEPFPAPSTGAAIARRAVREDFLQDWLDQRAGELLPQRPHRKIHREKLSEFLRRSQGGWFRLRDFQQHFAIDRKTAWEYLQKLRDAGLLSHNRERSAAVRYCLEDRFLVVRTAAVRRRVAEALSPVSPAAAVTVADWLIATGGEPFWDAEWQGRLDAGLLPHVLRALESAGLLEVVCQAAGRRLLRLPQRWLQSPEV